jgi:hypothetical protein
MVNIEPVSNFEEFEDDFYRVIVKSREVSSGAWIVRGAFLRKDTDEKIEGMQIWSNNPELALKQLEDKLREKMAALPRPPHEWGLVRVRMTLVTYRTFSDELTDALVSLEEKREKGALSDDQLRNAFHSVNEMVKNQTLKLVRMVKLLTEVEIQHLLRSSEDVYQNILDPWNLDDVYARDKIFDYILHPSPDLITLHKSHHERMNAEFERQPAQLGVSE